MAARLQFDENHAILVQEDPVQLAERASNADIDFIPVTALRDGGQLYVNRIQIRAIGPYAERQRPASNEHRPRA